MNTLKRLSAAALLAAVSAPLALAAHTHVTTPSTWAINLKESNFGTGPSSKSDTFTVTTDTDKWLEYSEVAVDSDGNTLKTSWSGPQDGSLRPIVGLSGGQASFDTAADTTVQMFPDGSKMSCGYSLPADKKKYIEKCVITFQDGKTTKQTLVYDRIK